MWIEFEGDKTRLVINMDKILWVEPTPGGNFTNLVLAPGVAVLVKETYQSVMDKIHPYSTIDNPEGN